MIYSIIFLQLLNGHLFSLYDYKSCTKTLLESLNFLPISDKFSHSIKKKTRGRKSNEELLLLAGIETRLEDALMRRMDYMEQRMEEVARQLCTTLHMLAHLCTTLHNLAQLCTI